MSTSESEYGGLPRFVVEEVNRDYAAGLVRHILETFAVPRVGYMLGRTLRGEPVRACEHLVGLPGMESRATGLAGLAVIDWMCEGVGVMCERCAVAHMSDPATPHRDPRHECCIVCGYSSDHNLHALAATVELREHLMVASDQLELVSKLSGKRIARPVIGEIVTTPIVWECPAHDGFLDSEVKLIWPPLGSGGKKPKSAKGKPPKGRGAKSKKGGRKRR